MHNKKEACFLRDNLKIIDDNGKIPKKESILKIWKTNSIQLNKRYKLTYNNSFYNNNNSLSTDFNHDIIIKSNVTKEQRTMIDVEV